MKINIAHTPPYNRIRTEAFWDRFTQAELVDYDVASQHEPSASAAAKKTSAKLRLFRRDADVTGFRNLQLAKTRAFVTGLEGTVLVAGRAAVILDTVVSKVEAHILPGEMA
jgi:hypothetical protein